MGSNKYVLLPLTMNIVCNQKLTFFSFYRNYLLRAFVEDLF